MMVLLWALGLAGFLVNADNRAIAPLLPAIANDLVIRESTAGLLVSAYSIPYGLFQLVYGPIADRIGKLRTISIALSLFSLGTIACSFIDDFSTLFVLRMVNGTFAAGIVPVALAQIGDTFNFQERAGAISFFMSFCMSGQALGIVVGSMLAQFFSWKILFLVIGLSGIPAALLFIKQQSAVLTPLVSQGLPLKERYRKIFSSTHSRTVYLMVCLEGAILFGGFTYLGVYANRILDLNYFVIGLLTACFSIAAFAGSWYVSPTIARVSRHRMPQLGSAILALAFALIWLIPHWLGLCLGFFLMGFGYIFIHSTLQTYATELLPESRGTCMSLFAFFLFLGNGIGPACFGMVYDIWGAYGMLATATFCLAVYSFSCHFAFKSFAHLDNANK